MSSNKSWAQRAAGKIAKKPPAKSSNSACQSNMVDPQPMLFQPLIPALAMLDVKCPRCKHKNHPIVLDDIANDERRPGCAECDACFPSAGAAMAPCTSTRATPARKDMPTQIFDSPSVVPVRRDGAGVGVHSIEQSPPDGRSATIEPAGPVPPLLQEDLSMPSGYSKVSAREHLLWPSSRNQPDMNSPDFPNVAFFSDLKQKSKAAISAELFEGSIPDYTPKDKRGLQAPIGSAASVDDNKQDRSYTKRPTRDWRRILGNQGGTVPLIFHNFEEGLAREFEERMREG
jgi:hypothetical protein